MRGLNTETDARQLSRIKGKAGPAFAQFQNLTMTTETIRPVNGDGTHTSPTFAETQLGTSIVSQPFQINGTAGYLAYVAQASGTVQLRNGTGGTGPLAVASPSAPTFDGYSFGRWIPGIGGYGTERIYAAAWTALGADVSGIAAVVSVIPKQTHFLAISGNSGAAPARAGGITCGSGTANTGTIQAFFAGGAHTEGPWALISGIEGTFASGETVNWGTNGTGTLEWNAMDSSLLQKVTFTGRAATLGAVGDAIAGSLGTGTVVRVFKETTSAYQFVYGLGAAFPSAQVLSAGTSGVGTVNAATMFGAVLDFSPSGTLPAGATGWDLYRLSNAGIYHQVGSATGTASITDESTDADITDYNVYSGPLDTQGLPDTLVVPGTQQTLCLHKGCLFLGDVNGLVSWSEGSITGKEYRWFRAGFQLDVGGAVWGMVSRGEGLEIYTPNGIKNIIGNAPYFELRDTQIHEVATSRFSIVGTDYGTFYQAADGLRVLQAGVTKLLSQGWNRPWFTAIATPGSTIAGASKGRYYLVDSTGRTLIFDWEAQEWSSRTFAVQPGGFRWSPTGRYLVAKVASSYVSVESDATEPVSWIVQYPTRAGARNRPIPSGFWLDNVGPMDLTVYVDDAVAGRTPITDTTHGRVRLPMARGVDWYLTLSGTGTPASAAIRSLGDT